MTSHWKLFRKETIQVDLKAGTKGDVLAELVRLVVSAGGIAEERGDQVLAALEEREKIGSTGVGSGVAIPHVKHEAVAESVGALGIARRPIDFQSVDGEPCDLFFLVLSPPDHAERHLEILRWLSSLVRDPDFPRFLRGARSVKEVQQLLREMAG